MPYRKPAREDRGHDSRAMELRRVAMRVDRPMVLAKKLYEGIVEKLQVAAAEGEFNADVPMRALSKAPEVRELISAMLLKDGFTVRWHPGPKLDVRW